MKMFFIGMSIGIIIGITLSVIDNVVNDFKKPDNKTNPCKRYIEMIKHIWQMTKSPDGITFYYNGRQANVRIEYNNPYDLCSCVGFKLIMNDKNVGTFIQHIDNYSNVHYSYHIPKNISEEQVFDLLEVCYRYVNETSDEKVDIFD